MLGMSRKHFEVGIRIKQDPIEYIVRIKANITYTDQ
jgi:hypothetical protein